MATTARQVMEEATSEDELLEQVSGLLDATGWEWFHDNAVNVPGAHINRPGFPDVCAVHPRTGHVLFLELKRAGHGRKLRPAQERWADALDQAERLSQGAVRYYVIEPASWKALESIVRTLAVQQVVG